MTQKGAGLKLPGISPIPCYAILWSHLPAPPIPAKAKQMMKYPGCHTALWVPRFWPAVGGTEFHSHQLAQHLTQDHRVTVVTHCTVTEHSRHPLTRLAAESTSTDQHNGAVRTVTISPEARYQKSLAKLGERYDGNVFTRRAYQLLFDRAFRKAAFHLLAEADRVHCIYNGLTESALLASVVAARLKIPFIFTPNVLDTSAQGSAWASARFRHLYHRAEQLIALTEHEATWLVAQGAESSKIAVVPYGPILTPSKDVNKSTSENSILQQSFILFLGRLVPEKGYQELLDAFRLMAISNPMTSLVFVGPSEPHVSALIDDFNRQQGTQHVHLLQDVSQPMKTALLEQAAVLCVPSTMESLGGVYIEAMACGTPVVALDRPVSRCVIEHGKEGLLVANTPQALVAALKTLINDADLARSMGLAGRKKVASQYDWPLVKENMLRAYTQADAVVTGAGIRAA